MSDIDDCASQEIDASDSSISTRNSKKYSFVQSILNVDQSQNVCGNGKQNILLGDRDSRLLPPGKQEFIHNWILTHGNDATLSPILCPSSPIFGALKHNSSVKRSAHSQIFNNNQKRVCCDINTKENFAFFTNGVSTSFEESSSDETIVISENEKSEDQSPAVFLNISNNDSDITCVNSPILNVNNSSSALNASETSSNFFASRASNERRSLIHESSKTARTLKLSSPLGRLSRAEINKKNIKKSYRDKNNCRRNNISVKVSGITKKIISPIKTIKLEAGRTSSINDRDSSKFQKNVSSSSSFMANEKTNLNVDREIDKQNRLSRRLSWFREKNCSMKLESSSTSKNCNRQSPVRRLSKLTDTGSSTFCESDRIDVESSIPVEEEIKIESDSDETHSDFIESVKTQNLRAPLPTKNICKIENVPSVSVQQRFKPRRDVSCDSDETYYSNGDLIPSLPSSPKHSQRIFQQKSEILISQVASPLVQNSEPSVSVVPSQDKSDILISQVPSPLRQNLEVTDYVAPLNTSSDSNKKKKKAKKGSLLAKLQSLVSSQVSNLHIWRYQMSQPKFKGSHTQFVTLRVLERKTRWHRHYITASLIADSHNLLDNIFVSQSNSANGNNVSSYETRTVTLMIVPEVTGSVKIKENSTLNIYPPWDIMHRDGLILNVMYFQVIPNLTTVDVVETQKKRSIERIIQKFDCPCIRSNAIVELCPEKFSDGKPSVMEALFGTSRFCSIE